MFLLRLKAFKLLAVGAFVLFSEHSPSGLLAASELDQRTDLLVKIFGPDEGLPSFSVTSVAQTPDGYIWIGTLFSGLLRFDGLRFSVFSPSSAPELVSMLGVRQLEVDQIGRLWINTYADTLLYWTPAGFETVEIEHIQIQKLLWSDQRRVIFASLDGQLLAGTRIPGGWKWEFIRPPVGLGGRSVCADAEGQIWVLINEKSIWRWRNGQTDILTTAPGLENKKIQLLANDHNHVVWAGTDKGLARWQDDVFLMVPAPFEQDSFDVQRIVPAGDGIWVEGNGVMRYMINSNWIAECSDWIRFAGLDNKVKLLRGDAWGGLWATVSELGIVHITPNGKIAMATFRDGFPSGSPVTLFCDREGNAWTGFTRGALVEIHPRLFDIIGPNQGLTEVSVNSVCVDSAGAAWVGTSSGNVYRFQNGKRTKSLYIRTVPTSGVVVAADNRGQVWIGSGTGEIVRYDEASQSTNLVAKLQNAIRLILAGRDGRVWVGTRDSIYVIKSGQIVKVYEAPKVSSADTRVYLSSLGEAQDGTIWAGTLHGSLLRYDGIKFGEILLPSGSKLGRIWSLCAAPDGGIFLGTSAGGLGWFAEGKFRLCSSADGLPSDCIVQVLVDDSGNLWLGTYAGIVRILKKDWDRFFCGELNLVPYSIYGKSDGLLTVASAIEFQPDCWRAANGELLFAMVNSVAVVDPRRVDVNTVPPGIGLEEVRCNGKSIWPKRCGTMNSQPLAAGTPVALRDEIRLGPGRKDLEFQYAGLSFDSPLGLRFRYRLDGLDTVWHENITDRQAIYRGLGPGKYNFRLQACNRDGLWSSQEVTMPVVVLPFFWETTWFMFLLGCFLLLVAISAVVIPLRVRHRRRLNQLRQQNLLALERARIAHDLHDDLGAGLAQIGLLGSLAQRPSTTKNRVQEYLKAITQKAQGLVAVLDEIVWAVNPKHDSTTSLSSYLCDYAQEFLCPAGISCRLNILPLPQCNLSSNQRHQLFLAFKEALSNIVRHAEATEVWLAIGPLADGFQVKLEDNGKGFYPVVNQPGADGLQNMKTRMEQLGGNCQILPRMGGGTSVVFTLPIVRSIT